MSVRENLPSHTGSYNFHIPTEGDYSIILLHLGLFYLGRSRNISMTFYHDLWKNRLETYVLIMTQFAHGGQKI